MQPVFEEKKPSVISTRELHEVIKRHTFPIKSTKERETPLSNLLGGSYN